MKKKLISILLVIAMLMTVMPGYAFAASKAQSAEKQKAAAAAALGAIGNTMISCIQKTPDYEVQIRLAYNEVVAAIEANYEYASYIASVGQVLIQQVPTMMKSPANISENKFDEVFAYFMLVFADMVRLITKEPDSASAVANLGRQLMTSMAKVLSSGTTDEMLKKMALVYSGFGEALASVRLYPSVGASLCTLGANLMDIIASNPDETLTADLLLQYGEITFAVSEYTYGASGLVNAGTQMLKSMAAMYKKYPPPTDDGEISTTSTYWKERLKLKEQFTQVVASIYLSGDLIDNAQIKAALGVYKDIKLTAWYVDSVYFCVTKKIMNGKDIDKFGPDDTMTRAELITAIWKLNGSPKKLYSVSYSDVEAGQWYEVPIGWAAKNNLIPNQGRAEFGVAVPATREEIAVILYNYAKLKASEFKDIDSGYKMLFSDKEDISDWAMAAFSWCNYKGIISGTTINGVTNLAAPGKAVTRAEFAAMAERFWYAVGF